MASGNGDGATNLYDLNPFVALLEGGGGSGLRAAYTYDGENRLVRVGSPGTVLHYGDQKVEYVYDYSGRRIAKKAFKVLFDIQPLGWELVEYRKFVWSDWLLLMELDGMAGNAVVRKYTWGLDVAGLSGNQSPERERAGLSATDPNRDRWGVAALPTSRCASAPSRSRF